MAAVLELGRSGYYPPPRALKSNPRAGGTSVVGRWRICDGAATTGRSAMANFLIRLGERRAFIAGQPDINRLVPSRVH
jgi:hypothetical protein